MNSQLLHRAIEALLQSKNNSKNVLCHGYRKKRPLSGGHSLPGLHSVEVIHENSTTAYLKDPVWCLLHSRIGDTLMLYLLTQTQMFQRLENDCCIQLTGTPIASIARSIGLHASPVIDEARNVGGRVKCDAHDAHEVSLVTQQDDDTVTIYITEDEAMSLEQTVRQVKRKRLSSWQRRRLRRLRRQTDDRGVLQPTQPIEEDAPREFPDKIGKMVNLWPEKFNKPVDMVVSNQTIFHSVTYSRRAGLANSHIINTLRKQKGGERERLLYAAIFMKEYNPLATGIYSKDRPHYLNIPQIPRRIPAKHRQLLPLLRSMLGRAKNVPFNQLLKVHCPLPMRSVDTAQPFSTTEDSVLSASFLTYNQVSSFVWALIKRLVPSALLGGSWNKRHLRKSITHFVSLRNNESTTVHRLMQNLRIRDYSWLSCGSTGSIPANKAIARQRLLSLWVAWLFASLIIPIIRSHFYCTGTEAYRQQVFYYRKPVWSEIRRRAISDLTTHQFAPVSTKSAQGILSTRKLGVSKLRMVPKRSGMRFIINLARKNVAFFPASRAAKRRSTTKGTKLMFPPVNDVLQNVFHVLKLEVSRQPECLQGSLFNNNDVYCRLYPFLKKWRSLKCGKPNIVSFDITRAFDNIDIPLLMTAITPMFLESKYVILKYTQVKQVLGIIRVKQQRLAAPYHTEKPVFLEFARKRSATLSQSLFSDSAVCDYLDRETALELLEQHLTANLIKLKAHWHKQVKGIAQGSTLSGMLCSLYLAHLEKAHLAPLLENIPPMPDSVTTSWCGGLSELATAAHPRGLATSSTSTSTSPFMQSPVKIHSLLMRFIDDFLFITTERRTAESVLLKTMKGFDDYSVTINPAKTKANFPVVVKQSHETVLLKPNVHTTDDGNTFIKWCGLLINTCNLELQGDYTRYAGEHLRMSLTVPVKRRAGLLLRQRISLFLLPKMHPLLLDSTINSPETVRLNIYQALLMCAMKCHCYIKGLSTRPSAGAKIVIEAMELGISQLAKRTMGVKRVAPSILHSRIAVVQCKAETAKHHVRYLAYYAFHQVFKKKQAYYPGLITTLEALLASPNCERSAAVLKSVVDPSHSSCFQCILY